MKSLTITPELASKPLDDGTFRIRLRITQDRKHRRVALDFAVAKRFWNKKKKQVRDDHPNAETINAAISLKKSELDGEVSMKTILKQPVTARQVQAQLRHEPVGGSYLKWARRYILENYKGGTRDEYNSILNKVQGFLGESGDLAFSEIDYSFLKKYEGYLKVAIPGKKKRNGRNTIVKNLSILRIFWNEAVKAEVYDPPKDPFLKMDLTGAKVKPRTRLSQEQIEEFKQLDYPTKSLQWRVRAFWLMEYYLLGMRVSDLLTMRHTAFRRGVKFKYEPHKTSEYDKVIEFDLPEPAQALYMQLRNEFTKPTDYVFQFYPTSLAHAKRKGISAEQHKVVSRCTSLINKYLKKMSADAGWDFYITTHVARHSIARRTQQVTGNDRQQVGNVLFHSSAKSTKHYLDSEQPTVSKALVKRLYDGKE